MKKYPIIILLLSITLSSTGQSFYANIQAGVMGYQGELSLPPLNVKDIHPSGGIGLVYEFHPKFSVRGDFLYGAISGDDKFSIIHKKRRLTFNSEIFEFSLSFEYTPVNLYEHDISPFFFLGISRFKFSPFVKAENGSKIILYELSTEGQGFYKDRKPYNLRQFNIPFGGGFMWVISNRFRLGITGGIRKTFTDYLDDVSTTYIDQNLLQQKRGLTAVRYAFRGNEADPTVPYPGDGAMRGNPETKDWYYFCGINLRLRIAEPRGRERSYKYHPPKFKKGNVRCPVVF